MRLRLLLMSLAFSLATAFVVSAQSVSMRLGIAVQPHSPATLLETTHTVKDFLSGGKLKNVSQDSIVSYRIGWMSIPKSGEIKAAVGPAISVPTGIKPGETVNLPAHGVVVSFERGELSHLMFYVSEVQWEDGRVWTEDTPKLKQETEQLMREPRTSR